MNILIYAPSFYPKIGGLELNVERLSTQFAKMNHKVKLVCTTNLKQTTVQEKTFVFPVIRCPSFWELMALVEWCDVFWCPCISLKGLFLPLFLKKRPIVASHHTWYRRANGKRSWQDWLKYIATYGAKNISISQSIANDIPVPSVIIENSYNSNQFYETPSIEKSKDIVFLGRLVSDKGVDLLLKSIRNLKEKGLTPTLTIIGNGSDRESLEKESEALNIASQVNFLGQQTGRALVEILNSHRIMAVPSRWAEPFGVVALEGIACGCVVVGSSQGGLKSAIGNCGITFSNGNVSELTSALSKLLTEPDELVKYRAHASTHLSQHALSNVAKSYLKVMEKTIR